MFAGCSPGDIFDFQRGLNRSALLDRRRTLPHRLRRMAEGEALLLKSERDCIPAIREAHVPPSAWPSETRLDRAQGHDPSRAIAVRTTSGSADGPLPRLLILKLHECSADRASSCRVVDRSVSFSGNLLTGWMSMRAGRHTAAYAKPKRPTTTTGRPWRFRPCVDDASCHANGPAAGARAALCSRPDRL